MKLKFFALIFLISSSAFALGDRGGISSNPPAVDPETSQRNLSDKRLAPEIVPPIVPSLSNQNSFQQKEFRKKCGPRERCVPSVDIPPPSTQPVRQEF